MLEIEAPSAPAAARKPSKLMADLSAAILATAAAARDQALEQLDADAKQVTESIREGAIEGGTTLRKRSDDDVAGIRDWSKAEIARIREETDGRIATRKAQLEAELDGARVVGQQPRRRGPVRGRPLPLRHGRVLRAPGQPRRTRPSSRRWSRRCPTCRRSTPGPTSIRSPTCRSSRPRPSEAPVAEAEAVGEIEAVAEDAPRGRRRGRPAEAEGVAETAEPVADEAESGEISDGSFNVDATDEAEPAVGELEAETEEPAPAVSKGWGEGEGEWGDRAEDDDDAALGRR